MLFFVPVAFQERILTIVNIGLIYRLAIGGFGLAGFFLYAGFRAWDEAEEQKSQAIRDPELKITIDDYFVTDRPFDNDIPNWDYLVINSHVVNLGAPIALYNWRMKVVLTRGEISIEEYEHEDTVLESGRRLPHRSTFCLWDNELGDNCFTAHEIKSVQISCSDYLGNEFSSEFFRRDGFHN